MGVAPAAISWSLPTYNIDKHQRSPPVMTTESALDGGESTPVGLIIAIPVFLAVNALLAVVGARWMNRLSHDSSEDILTAHYLGGRSFGPWLTLGTTFATTFSGFTIIGIPNEAFNHGWKVLEWVALYALIVFIFAGAAPRLRKASLVRNHQTPSDFITDMFRSQLLRYATITIQLVAQFIWMTSNVVAVKNAFNTAFNLDEDYPWITVGVVAFILVSEWFGGLSAVALTDSVQGAIMVFGAISVTCVVKHVSGGWTALDPTTFLRPQFYQTPTRQVQWKWWQACFVNLAIVFYPVSIQRMYSASTLQGVKYGAWAMLAAPWIAVLPTIFIGTVGVQIIGEACAALPATDQEACMKPASPFATIMQQLINLGGFPEASAIILYTSALAAIMSSTDSVLISISQIITSDILYPMRPQATPHQVAWFGRFVSFFVAALALVLALTWKGSIISLYEMGTPMAMQLVPIFLVGLFMKHRPHPWSLAIPTFASIIGTIVIVICYEPPNAIDKATIITLLNCVAMVLCELGRLVCKGKLHFNAATLHGLRNRKKKTSFEDSDEVDDFDRQDAFPNRPSWDKPKLNRFGVNSLSPKLLDKMMIGMEEPMKNYQYVLLMILVTTMTVPLTAESQPVLENGVWVSLPATIRGLPWWAFKAIIISFVSTILVVPIIFSMPDDYPFDKDEVLRSGIDADIVELEPEEKGGRGAYDEPNEALVKRREMIRAHTVRIQLAKKEANEIAEEKRLHSESTTDARDRLGNLVKQPTRRVVPVFGESKWNLNENEPQESVEEDVASEAEQPAEDEERVHGVAFAFDEAEKTAEEVV